MFLEIDQKIKTRSSRPRHDVIKNLIVLLSDSTALRWKRRRMLLK